MERNKHLTRYHRPYYVVKIRFCFQRPNERLIPGTDDDFFLWSLKGITTVSYAMEWNLMQHYSAKHAEQYAKCLRDACVANIQQENTNMTVKKLMWRSCSNSWTFFFFFVKHLKGAPWDKGLQVMWVWGPNSKAKTLNAWCVLLLNDRAVWDISSTNDKNHMDKTNHMKTICPQGAPKLSNMYC